jgi:hypothetical protein
MLEENMSTRKNEVVQHHYSMLIFISPSLVSVMPCKPTRLGPKVGVMLKLPPLFDRSPLDCPLMDVSRLAFVAVPQRLPSRWLGDCEMTGLLCTLRPGDTARRLSECSSKSSSRRRLLDFFSPSAAVGGFIDCGVEAREVQFRLTLWSGAGMPLPLFANTVGESMFMSSLIAAEDSARLNDGGGGVCARRWFQKSVPIELRPVFNDPNVPNNPLVVEPSRLMLLSLSSSGTPSNGPSKPGTVGRRLGED